MRKVVLLFFLLILASFASLVSADDFSSCWSCYELGKCVDDWQSCLRIDSNNLSASDVFLLECSCVKEDSLFVEGLSFFSLIDRAERDVVVFGIIVLGLLLLLFIVAYLLIRARGNSEKKEEFPIESLNISSSKSENSVLAKEESLKESVEEKKDLQSEMLRKRQELYESIRKSRRMDTKPIRRIRKNL